MSNQEAAAVRVRVQVQVQVQVRVQAPVQAPALRWTEKAMRNACRLHTQPATRT